MNILLISSISFFLFNVASYDTMYACVGGRRALYMTQRTYEARTPTSITRVKVGSVVGVAFFFYMEDIRTLGESIRRLRFSSLQRLYKLIAGIEPHVSKV